MEFSFELSSIRVTPKFPLCHERPPLHASAFVLSRSGIFCHVTPTRHLNRDIFHRGSFLNFFQFGIELL